MTDETDLYTKIGRIDANVSTLLKRTEGFDKRLTTVEHRQWWLSGVAAAVGVFFSRLGGHIT